MRIIILTSILLFVTNLSFSQSNNLNGIKFLSKEVPQSSRTSVCLNDDEPIYFHENLTISFDLAFWSTKVFGSILRVFGENGPPLRMVYNQFKSKDTSYIQLFNSNNKSINIPLAKNDLIRNKWFNFKITFDKKNRLISASLNEKRFGSIDYTLKETEPLKFIFGIVKSDNARDFDIPGFYLKNIRINENEKLKYYWTLIPDSEKGLIDEVAGSRLLVKNISWMIEDHFSWKLLKEYNSKSFNGAAYDSINSLLYMDFKNDLVILDLKTGRDSTIKFKEPSPAYWNDLFIDYSNKRLYSFMNGMDKISIYDIKSGSWIKKDTSQNNAANYFGSAKFVDNSNGGIYLLGGYGHFTVKKDLFKYNFAKETWEIFPLKKNELQPRAWFTLGNGFNPGEYLIFGGFGNESGKQEEDFKNFNDIFLLNLNDSTLTKLDHSLNNKFDFAFLINYLHINRKDSSFLFAARQKEDKVNFITLYSYNLLQNKLEQLADTLWKSENDDWIYHYLHYNKTTNELIAVIYDDQNVKISTLNYPPVKASLLPQKLTKESSFSFLYYVAGGILLLVVIGFIVFLKGKYKINHPKDLSSRELLNTDNSNLTKNYIQAFGGFHLYNNEGKDIILDFSPKLKEIFLLILLRSLNHYQYKGITSEKLSSFIWPDSSHESVKSSRGVAINKIRKLLSSVEGVELEFADKLWLIKINNGARCDYAEFIRLSDAVKNRNGAANSSFTTSISIVENGEFLKGISYEWLDPVKFSINNEVIGFLKQYFDYEEVQNDPEKLIKLCDVILSFDSVDQDAIKLKLKTLSSTGNHHIAKSTYSLFVAEYKRLFDEQFPNSFDEMISS